MPLKDRHGGPLHRHLPPVELPWFGLAPYARAALRPKALQKELDHHLETVSFLMHCWLADCGVGTLLTFTMGGEQHWLFETDWACPACDEQHNAGHECRACGHKWTTTTGLPRTPGHPDLTRPAEENAKAP